ncbi:glycerophosphoryl diester phosphodiesterase [Oryzihumus leptocrescens]|uniref:Glycerophosphoryl diester phosphodiesterase n=2 Tax=Oryzihumus leptocrescens TaxID=297536 RepID=A0A542Z9Z7_9MICO|nr:glycerophosphodiester phosphodiesterase family protein [Oryzihumus leptocrescens]TQL57121.1 glycerophosphoryl diester phosphodiesterase [Oryzihumus leptocrescens]
MSYGAETGPLAIAHRGGGGLAPENTLAAFARATALGVRYLETDLRPTSDGSLVCFHDETLERVTAARGRVASRTVRGVRSLRVAGVEQVPTLVEALEAFPEARFTVDLKDAAAIAPLVRVLRRPGVAERVCVAGAWDGWLGFVQREVPAVTTALGWRSLTALVACARAGVRPPRAVATGAFAHVPVRLGLVPVFVARLVQMAHDIGVRVVVWTVDDPAAMGRFLDLGVDGVISDRPDLLREVLIARGQWAPMPQAQVCRVRTSARGIPEGAAGSVLGGA